MKKFFSKLQSSGNDAKGQPISDDELQQQLKSVQASLGKLKNAREEDFPLLNESTRLVQKLEGSVASMPDGDMRMVWKEQLSEIQRDLKAATESMMTRAVAQHQVAQEGSGLLFDGLDIDATMPDLTQAPKQIPKTSSLIPTPEANPKSAKALDQKEANAAAASWPLDEDLFSSLGNLQPSTDTSPADPFQIPEPVQAAPAPPPSSIESSLMSLDDPPHNMNGSDNIGQEGRKKKRISKRVGAGRGSEGPTTRQKGRSHDAAQQPAPQAPGEKKDFESLQHQLAKASEADQILHMPPKSEANAVQILQDRAEELCVRSTPSNAEAVRPDKGSDRDVKEAVLLEKAARKQRQEAMLQLSRLKDKLLELQCAETDAVEAEDFERAGQLSQESGQLQGKIKSLYNTQTQAESALYNAVQNRWQLSMTDIQKLRESADKLKVKAAEQTASSQQAKEHALQLAGEVELAKSRAAEHKDSVRLRLEGQEKTLAVKQAEVDEQIRAATDPAARSRQQQQDLIDKLATKVEKLRLQLAEEEAKLHEAEEELVRRNGAVQQAAGSFEAILLKLDEERREIEAERDNSKHEIDAQRAKESQAVTSLSSAEQEAESLREQAASMSKEAEEFLRKAGDLEKSIQREQQAYSLRQSLQASHCQSMLSLESRKAELEAARSAVRDLNTRKASLAAAAATAEEQAASAKRRLPKIDADKKLAATAKDFQEAARLSAEAKSLASTAQAKEAEAASLASEASAVDSDQIRCIAQVEVCERALAEAELAVAEARCKLLQADLESIRQQQWAAEEAEACGDAEALQAEGECLSKELASLITLHNLPTPKAVQDTPPPAILSEEEALSFDGPDLAVEGTFSASKDSTEVQPRQTDAELFFSAAENNSSREAEERLQQPDERPAIPEVASRQQVNALAKEEASESLKMLLADREDSLQTSIHTDRKSGGQEKAVPEPVTIKGDSAVSEEDCAERSSRLAPQGSLDSEGHGPPISEQPKSRERHDPVDSKPEMSKQILHTTESSPPTVPVQPKEDDHKRKPADLQTAHQEAGLSLEQGPSHKEASDEQPEVENGTGTEQQEEDLFAGLSFA